MHLNWPRERTVAERRRTVWARIPSRFMGPVGTFVWGIYGEKEPNMPRRKSVVSSGAEIPSELLDLLVPGPMSAEGVGEVMTRFKKALIEASWEGS